jgi:AcrR family transcriptional regulator
MGKSGKAGGRPPYQPSEKDRAQVRMLSAMGIPQDDIARVIGITRPTLTVHFRDELDVGAIEANAKVAASLFRAATDSSKPNVVAAIFWLKVRAGWRESEGINPAETPGKRAQAQADAKTAHVGTEWDGLLRPTGHLQ